MQGIQTMISLSCRQLWKKKGWVAVITVVAVLCGCDPTSSHARASPVAQVQIAAVLVREISTWDSFTGRIAAIDSVQVQPRVSGYITRNAYAEGSEMKRGDLLFVIYLRPYLATLQSAQARLERARASVVLTEAQSHRAQRLLPSNAISKDDAETRQAAFLQSKAI